MRVLLLNGEVRHFPLSVAGATGYIAKRIELEGPDFAAMARLLEHSPEQLRRLLAQLQSRLVTERLS